MKVKKLITAVMAFAMAACISGCVCPWGERPGSAASQADIAGGSGGGEEAAEAGEGFMPEPVFEYTEGSVRLMEPELFLEKIPEYDSRPYIVINGNKPFFTEENVSSANGEFYSSLDELGRCGSCIILVSEETMPAQDETREMIGSVHPSGWRIVKFDGIDGNYLYNRCHLAAWQLSGENANPCNLITGTRYLNTQGMAVFENQVGHYVRGGGSPVLYRVTPVFSGDELLARGVIMEATSVDDKGASLSFNVYCYNVQPGVKINYSDGYAEGEPYKDRFYAGEGESSDNVSAASGDGAQGESGQMLTEAVNETVDPQATYVANVRSRKFHLPSCESAVETRPWNRLYFYGERQEVTDAGYEPCGRCKP